MRILVLATSLMATSLLTACAEGEGAYTPQAPVGESQVECFGYEQIFTDPNVSILDKAQAREEFFDNDCVLRGGSYG
jgi:hypothetical protein